MKAKNMSNSPKYFAELQKMHTCFQSWLHVQFSTCHWAGERPASCVYDTPYNLKFSYRIKAFLSK